MRLVIALTSFIFSTSVAAQTSVPPSTFRPGSEDTAIVRFEMLPENSGYLCDYSEPKRVPPPTSGVPSNGALWSDCQKLYAQQEVNKNGKYSITNFAMSENTTFTGLARLGTCTVGVKPAVRAEITPGRVYELMGEDNLQILHDPLESNKVNGSAPSLETEIEYLGYTTCKAGNLVWGIYNKAWAYG